MEMTVRVRDLKAGDYIIAIQTIVSDIQLFAGLAIVDLMDTTTTTPNTASAAR
jgi:hypothetical protein